MTKAQKPQSNKLKLRIRPIVIIVMLLLLLVALIGAFYFSRIINFRFNNLESSSVESEIEWNSNDRLSLLLVGLDEVDDRSFIDFIAVAIFEPSVNEFKIFNINPNIATYSNVYDSYLSFKSYPTYSNGLKTKEDMDELRGLVEGLTTIKTHGYVIVTKEDIVQMLNNGGYIDVLAPSNVNDKDLGDIKIEAGENRYKLEDIVKVLAADANGPDDKSKRQNSIMVSIIDSSFWLWNPRYINYITDPDQLKDKIITNLTPKDILKLYKFIYWNSALEKRVGYVQINSTYKLDDPIESKFAPIYETLDADLQQILLNREANIEQLKIDVLNSTSASGMARIKARWLKNRGIRVVITGNTDENYTKNTLFILDPEKYPNTIREIRQTLKGDVEIRVEQYPKRAVGNAVLIVGENELD